MASRPEAFGTEEARLLSSLASSYPLEVLTGLGLDRDALMQAVDGRPVRNSFTNEAECVAAVVAFVKERQRWPLGREFTAANYLPGWKWLSYRLASWRYYQRSSPQRYPYNSYPYARDVRPGWFSKNKEPARFFGKSLAPSQWRRGETLQWRIVTAYKHLLTPTVALAIPNLTYRRDAIRHVGEDKVIRDRGVKVQQDDYGILWRLPIRDVDDQEQMFVEVVNATVNPDGSTDVYFLRVPPDSTTARAAVAWTFNRPPTTFEIAMAT